MVVNATATVFGGAAAQQVWTGTDDVVVVASASPAGTGGIALHVQGGTSSYWGGAETAALDDAGGVLDAFLGGGGAVSIGVDMAAIGGSTATIQGFDPALDTLVLRGLPSFAALAIGTDATGTTLCFGNSRILLENSFAPQNQAIPGVTVLGQT